MAATLLLAVIRGQRRKSCAQGAGRPGARVVLVNGARQPGKSTLVRALAGQQVPSPPVRCAGLTPSTRVLNP